ncbi:nucleotidyltransferase domain-containing protein [Inhella proteolytica]|uniref:Nucleotidyltransferase n=1 Tax=Inhella proteolytica TaxID=2795029 RepID=A0A931J8Q4_9BURK|nr:nucleotidyltransferase [Inhella proteolytica]MBH9578160.1 nucleotidyltransferase [Inhella proteolytica]
MAIPESQLDTWSHQGSIAQSSATYKSIKDVLEDSDTPYAAKNFKVFLQGSYGNDTNIYAESDVDIVICLNDCFQRDIDQLSEEDKAAYQEAFDDATYTHVEFKADVVSVLVDQYGKAVDVGDKAIAIDASGSRRKADVISAIQFRRYTKFKSISASEFIEGICFYNAKGEHIANYPRQHSANLTQKHKDTSKWFKPVARIFKNMRSRLVDDGVIAKGIAPSYYLEGLLYNVPSGKFHTDYQTCVANAINWYRNEAVKKELVCANEQYYLLRDGHHVCWNQANCDTFVDAAADLWNTW